MSFDPDEVKKQLRELEQDQAEQELIKTLKLSQRSIGIVVLLALFIPLTTYLYTRRWKALLFFGGFCLICGSILGLGASSEKEAIDRGLVAGTLLGTPITAIDNALAIRRAREKVRKS